MRRRGRFASRFVCPRQGFRPPQAPGFQALRSTRIRRSPGLNWLAVFACVCGCCLAARGPELGDKQASRAGRGHPRVTKQLLQEPDVKRYRPLFDGCGGGVSIMLLAACEATSVLLLGRAENPGAWNRRRSVRTSQARLRRQERPPWGPPGAAQVLISWRGARGAGLRSRFRQGG